MIDRNALRLEEVTFFRDFVVDQSAGPDSDAAKRIAVKCTTLSKHHLVRKVDK